MLLVVIAIGVTERDGRISEAPAMRLSVLPLPVGTEPSPASPNRDPSTTRTAEATTTTLRAVALGKACLAAYQGNPADDRAAFPVITLPTFPPPETTTVPTTIVPSTTLPSTTVPSTTVPGATVPTTTTSVTTSAGRAVSDRLDAGPAGRDVNDLAVDDRSADRDTDDEAGSSSPRPAQQRPGVSRGTRVLICATWRIKPLRSCRPNGQPGRMIDEAGSPAQFVRLATTGDGVAIGDVHAASWEAGFDHFLEIEFVEPRPPVVGTAGNTQSGTYSGCRIWCSSPDETRRCSAFSQSGRPDEGGAALEIFAFYCHPREWGTRLAEALMQETSAVLSTGARPAVLWTPEEAQRAHRFYERCGFTRTGRARTERLSDWQPAASYEEVVAVEYERSLS